MDIDIRVHKKPPESVSGGFIDHFNALNDHSAANLLIKTGKTGCRFKKDCAVTILQKMVNHLRRLSESNRHVSAHYKVELLRSLERLILLHILFILSDLICLFILMI